MKNILTLIVSLFASGLMMPTEAEARNYRIGHSQIYVSGYHPCGTPIKTKRVIVGFNHYRQPIYRYYTIGKKYAYKKHANIYYSKKYSQKRLTDYRSRRCNRNYR